MYRVGIVGASGYTGAELLRLAFEHPQLELAWAMGETQAGTEVADLYPSLAAAYPRTTWVEHFEWLEPLFNERLELRAGRMVVPDRPGLGLSLSERVAGWTVDTTDSHI